MLQRPRRLLGVALLALAILAALAHGPAAVAIEPADALRHEGQRVAVAGVLVAERPHGDGWRLDVAHDGHALTVLADRPSEAGLGAWVEAEGRLVRRGGLLALAADRIEVAPGPAPTTPSWDSVAAEPGAWQDRLLRLQGWVEGGELRDRAGHAVRLGDGTWPREGAVEATGTLSYDDGCLCHIFHAGGVRAWTA